MGKQDMTEKQMLEALSESEIRELYEAYEHGAKATGTCARVLKQADSRTVQSFLKKNSKVIYGPDDRVDVVAAQGTPGNRAESVVALIRANRLTQGSGGAYTLSAMSFQDEYGLCSGEPFGEQPLGAFCSGFLVAPDVIATAGHCIKNDGDLARTRFVFGFKADTAGSTSLQFPARDVYEGLKILGRAQNANGADWALIQLSRRVVGRSPLEVATSDAVRGDSVYVIGHPVGLPMKYAPNARVRDDSPSEHFVANLDTYGGNSGSAVFNDDHEVTGILVRGEADFVSVGGCRVSKVCPDTGCRGEDVTNASAFKGTIPKSVQVDPIAELAALVAELSDEVQALRDDICPGHDA